MLRREKVNEVLPADIVVVAMPLDAGLMNF
jgi:hypothetical protein